MVFLVFSLLPAIFMGNFVSAQTSSADPCVANIAGESHAQLQADLDACNADIAKWTAILNSTKTTTATYKTEVAILTAKINAAQANIKAKNIAIASLGADIKVKQGQINVLQNTLDADTSSLGELIRKTNEIDAYTLADAMLSSQKLSDFFSDTEAYNTISSSIESVQNNLRGVKAQTQSQKDALNKQLNQTADAKVAIEAAKAQVEVNQAEQKTLLAQSQNQEAAFANVVATKQAKADAIRAALFNLRDTAAIPFGTALTYAQAAQKTTGVDPAFLLAIMTQESNLGANVGACFLTNTVTGDGIGANTGSTQRRVMSPTRDVPVFLDILSHVGGGMTNTRVSCWQPIYSSSGAPLGWGGAMGPAQFIPSTWQLFATRIATMSGDAYPNPWNARDAFFASAIYLSDLGGGTGIYSDEKNAACKYYSGSSCKTSYANTYGTSVMNHASTIQTTMIDPLQGV